MASGAERLAGALYPTSYSNGFATLQGCRSFSTGGGFSFGTCVGAQVGSLAVAEEGGQQRRERGLWAAAQLGTELGLELSEAWEVFGRFQLAFPVQRHRLFLTGGEIAYELPAVSIQFQLGTAFQVTEFGRR
jgi:hypothetical protein